MSNDKGNSISRRNFLGTSLMGAAGFTILPGLSAMGMAPNDTLNLGFIGLGRQAMYLLNGFLTIPGVRVVAGCEVYARKNQRFEQRVKDYYQKTTKKKAKVKLYEKYQDLLADKDVDAVVIATPDHWHALIAIDACLAGKDVYLEKPLTFTIKEGQELIKAVRKNNRILAVGSQQRSDANFQNAVKAVQDGSIGKLERINAYVGAPPIPYNLPKEEVPADLNWDLWLGPNPYVHYNHELNPPISLDPPKDEEFWGGWRWYKELGGGFTTDWGAHMFDVAQWAMKMDHSGPIRVIPAGYQDFDYMTFEYANGVVMSERPWNEQKTKGVKFWGTDGWIEISRDFYKASDERIVPKNLNQDAGPFETKIPHLVNFIESVRAKKDPVVPVEVGHRTCTACTLGNIAHEAGRPIKWDPAKEQFADPKDSIYIHHEYRDGYKLPSL